MLDTFKVLFILTGASTYLGECDECVNLAAYPTSVVDSCPKPNLARLA